MTSVLVVDDEPQLLRALRVNLGARSYQVTTALTGGEALAAVAQLAPDIVVLDLGLPDMDGVEVIRGLRGYTAAPIVVLSGRQQADVKVRALDAGADDYVTKPFDVDELLARLRAVSRRQIVGEGTQKVAVGDYTVDLNSRRVIGTGATEVHLTPTEWQVLEALIRRPGKLISQRELLRSIRGPAFSEETYYLRNLMARLRRKLEPEPSRPHYLITEPGMGYRFQP